MPKEEKSDDLEELYSLPLSLLLDQTEELIPVKLIMFKLAQELLEDKPDTAAINWGRESLLDIGMEEEWITQEVLREFAENMISSLVDEKTAIETSKQFVKTSQILSGGDLWALKTSIEKMSIGEANSLLQLQRLVPQLKDAGEAKPKNKILATQSSMKFSTWREERAKLFKSLKDKKPNLSQSELAGMATGLEFERIFQECEVIYPNWNKDRIETITFIKFEEKWKKSQFSIDDVRNDYRDKGWSWLRANRTR